MRYNIFLVLFILSIPATSTVSTMVVFDLTAKVLEVIKTLLELSSDINDHADIIELPKNKAETELFDALDKINLDIINLSHQINGISGQLNMIMKIIKNFPNTVRNELVWKDLRYNQYFIDVYYREMEKYIRNQDEYENKTLITFAQNVLASRPNSVQYMTKIIFKTLLDQDFIKNLYNLYKPETEIYYCQEGQSHQQTLLTFLSTILLMDLKSFVLMKTSYLLKRQYKLGKFTREMKDLDIEFKTRTSQFISALKPFIANASQEVWRCDPVKHKKDVTYSEITNFVHGFVLNKANLDAKQSCAQECYAYPFTKKTECNVENSQSKSWCQEQSKCSTIIDCHYVDSSMDVCVSKMSQNNRRYNYIKFGNGKAYGKTNKKCIKTQYLETYLNWLRRCSYCFCLCVEADTVVSDRYINLRLARSNISNNKVVTGLRFIKHNRIIHLQVQEGKLLPQGKIDLNSVRWIPPENYYLTDRKISEGQDYHTLTWDQRGFELSDIMIEQDAVVTGVRFKKVGTRLHLEVLNTKFNFTTGKLFQNINSFEEDPLIAFKHRFGKELKLIKPDVPTLAQPSTYSDFTTNKYVKFRETDFEKDAGQTTVPFFDTQPVTSKVLGPLSGVGIFHKGVAGSGGFLAPKIFTYNYTRHLQTMFPENDLL